MSFKCSVFGHRYGDPDVEREREEQGSEVVITIKETETCKRCGETRVVSENKEVTTLETPSDIVGDDIADEEGEEDDVATESEPITEAEPDPPAEPDVAAEQAGDDAELIDDTDESTPASPEPTGVDQSGLGSEEVTDETPDPDEDDGVILDASDDEDGEDDTREPGQWPDELDDEEDEDDEDDWSPAAGNDLRPVEEEQPDIEPTNSAVTVPEGEFYCPECEFTTDVESSSLRAGDFCPECHRGSLTHRSEEA
jgi:ssDNA-binding Zn-finger/Zn-ribbon topoisomerase 1